MDIQLDLNPLSATFNDLLVQENDLVLVTGGQEILQHILQNLRTFLGEWFLDNTVGVPYFQQILVKNPNQGVVDAILQSTIRTTPGVTFLTKYSANLNVASRQLIISFQAQSTSGVVNYTGLV